MVMVMNMNMNIYDMDQDLSYPPQFCWRKCDEKIWYCAYGNLLSYNKSPDILMVMLPNWTKTSLALP